MSDSELAALASLAEGLVDSAASNEDPELLAALSLECQELPRRVRRFFNDFRLLEPPAGGVLVRGYPVDDQALGPTPAHWSQARTAPSLRLHEAALGVLASLLGDVFGWSTQQDGRIFHDVVPTPGMEAEQLGAGSHQPLEWHTEDAFHPFCCDYLALMCLRNPDAVATTLAPVDAVELTASQRETLFQPLFHHLPDDSHLPQQNSVERAAAAGVQASFARVFGRFEAPEPMPVLFGARESPYLRIDRFLIDRKPADPAAREALDALIAGLDAALYEIVLQAGDVLFIDNRKVVHGRGAFRPRYDGTDRWLKRVGATRDLRRSRGDRCEVASRVIG